MLYVLVCSVVQSPMVSTQSFFTASVEIWPQHSTTPRILGTGALRAQSKSPRVDAELVHQVGRATYWFRSNLFRCILRLGFLL
ncbi:hypothetical protein OE88DRAFT_9608 [Heliocybe sulcata]|uniref:Uncharacterized protein n=1 Tax=Heliocybe sulcata TaxID=5364 RepID=A0A5C3NG88_9AGAM|nr:hypothetical protein OE88DRAFT_9608 [Heliocybe sulcata]